MGFMDKIRGLTHKLRPAETHHVEDDHPSLTLRIDEQDQWVVQMLAASGIDGKFKEFQQHIQEVQQQIKEAAAVLVQDETLEKLPERARSTAAVHSNEFVQQTEKVVDAAAFSDAFTFEDDQHAFHQALEVFRTQTGKNVSALKEFLAEEIGKVQRGLQELEDASLGFLQTMEEKRFEQIKRVQKAMEDLQSLGEQHGKFDDLGKKLKEDLKACQEKQAKITQKIAEQRKLIRNPTALQALDDLANIEEELDEITRQHEHAASDALTYFKKNAEIDIPTAAHDVLHSLPRHPSSYLAEHPDEVRQAFEAIAEHLEQEGRGKLGNLVQRLHDRAENASKDGARAGTMLPKQQDLKKQIMRDVAAINIYDQQQFLLRAKREEKELEAKIAYVGERLERGDNVAIEREMKDAAIAFGAAIEGASLDEVKTEEITEEDTPKVSDDHEESISEEPVHEESEKEDAPADKHEEPTEEPNEDAEQSEEKKEDEIAEAHEEESDETSNVDTPEEAEETSEEDKPEEEPADTPEETTSSEPEEGEELSEKDLEGISFTDDEELTEENNEKRDS